MSLWRDGLTLQPELWDFQRWPLIDADTLAQSARKTFITNRRIVSLVLNNMPLNKVAQQFNCSPARVTLLMNRCFERVDGDYALTKALIPYTHVKPYERIAPLPTLRHCAGASGALGALWMSFPYIKIRLDHILIQRLKEHPGSGPISSAGFHGMFKVLLAEYGYPKDQWPYTSQDQGRETLRRYLHRQWETLRFEHLQRCRSTQDVKSVQRISHSDRLFGRIEIDAQRVDFRGRLNIVFNDQLIPLSLARAWLYCAIDVSTDCILGYIVIYKKKPSRWDVLRLLAKSIRPWKPHQFSTPEFAYEPGACFPSALPECVSIAWHQVAFDNDWVHHAKAIEQFLIPKMGATIHFGFAREPRQRKWIEHTFDNLNRRLSHRLPSTTGSSILDPKREPRKNQKQPPLMTYLMFREALELVLSQHNIRKQGGRLAGACPIDLVREKAARHWMPYVPEHQRSHLDPMEIKQRMPVKLRKDGSARHINFESTSYPCATLEGLRSSDYELDIVVNTDDVRALTAYNLDGKMLGHVYAPKSWQSYPHSMDTRQMINALVRKDRLRAQDLLAGALLRLIESPDKCIDTQGVLRLYSEYTGGDYQQSTTSSLTLPETNQPHAQKTTVRGSRYWQSKEAYHAQERDK